MSLRLIITFFALGLVCLQAQADSKHTVQKGETLYSIGQQYTVEPSDILKVNPGLDPRKLRIGQAVIIPGEDSAQDTPTSPQQIPTTYTVQQGESLTTISRKFGIPLEELKARNRLSSTVLQPGQKLTLKAATSPSAPPPQAPASPSSSSKINYVFLNKKVLAKIDAPSNLRAWKNIVVHHSGTPNGNAKIFDYFHSHIRGMENGLAYHFVIGNGTDSGDGEIEIGPRWSKQLQGGHLHSDELNEISIGICLVGDFSKKSPSKAQVASLIELVSYLKKRCASSRPRFYVHREINPTPTECPGKMFPSRSLHQLFD